jgi:multidrug efflux system membrane fusion protein
MKRVITLLVLLAVAAGLYVYAAPRLAGVTAASAQQTASTGGQGARSGRAGAPAIAVVTAVARQQSVPISKSAVAYIEPAQMVVVRTRADGTVVSQNVTEGQTVKAGDVLFKLDDSAIQAQIAKDEAQIAKDQANADAAQVTVGRDQDLVKKQVDPQSTLDADVATAKAAQATVTLDQAQLKADQVQLSYMTITAPIAGRVGTVNTSVGNVVHAADTSTDGLLTITQMSPLRVSFSIAEGDLDSFRTALAKQPKGLEVAVAAQGDKAPRATGLLNFIDSSVDTSSGTIVLKADVDNGKEALWPGQYVTATTQLGAYDNATTIPLQAVQQGSDGSFVFLVDAGGKVKKQPISVVATVGELALVGKEVKPGDHVVTEGQLRLSDGSMVRETVQGGTKVASDAATSGGNGTAGPAEAGASPVAAGTSTANS